MDIEHLFKLMTVMSKTQVSSEVEDKIKELIMKFFTEAAQDDPPRFQTSFLFAESEDILNPVRYAGLMMRKCCIEEEFKFLEDSYQLALSDMKDGLSPDSFVFQFFRKRMLVCKERLALIESRIAKLDPSIILALEEQNVFVISHVDAGLTPDFWNIMSARNDLLLRYAVEQKKIEQFESDSFTVTTYSSVEPPSIPFVSQAIEKYMRDREEQVNWINQPAGWVFDDLGAQE